MKYLRSIVDGFNIVIGTPVTNIAAFFVLCIVIRKPPHYTKDSNKSADQLNYDARLIFSILIIAHFFTAIFMLLLRSQRFRNNVVSLVSIFMALWSVILCNISGGWSFPRRTTTTPRQDLWENEKQYQFEIWLFYENVLIWSYIFGTMVYLLGAFFRSPSESGYGPASSRRSNLQGQ